MSDMTKTIKMIRVAVDTAFAIRRIFADPIPNEILIKKRPFPDRKKPHRLKRKMKERVRLLQGMRVAEAAIVAAMGMAEASKIAGMPEPTYAKGGYATIGEAGPENVILPHAL